MDKCTYGWIERSWTDGWMNEHIDEWTDEWINIWINGHIVQWADRWMDI